VRGWSADRVVDDAGAPLLSTHLERLLEGVRTVTVRELSGRIVVIDDCYNANPMSMPAALDHLAASASADPGLIH
jgi:UDP-N-acetylmuramyl pentapeptide synthase